MSLQTEKRNNKNKRTNNQNVYITFHVTCSYYGVNYLFIYNIFDMLFLLLYKH